MKVTVDDVKKMAALSMLNIDESKLEEFRKNLEAILEHVMKLNELDTEGIEPTTYILDQKNIFREDIPEENKFDKESLLKNAPKREGDFFIVPRVVE